MTKDINVQENKLLRSQPQIIRLLSRLASNPPSSLILEGGEAEERLALSKYLLKTLNCPDAHNGPCLECALCAKIDADVFRDMFLLDPQDGLSVDHIRELRPILAQKPRHSWRMIIIAGAGDLNISCANALLKSVEEPVSRNCFVFLAAQREHLLPTLISRSFVLTLTRRTRMASDQEQEELYREFSDFVVSGRGFIHGTSKKNPLSLDQARQFLARIQVELAKAQRGEQNPFMNLAPQSWYRMNKVLHTAFYALSCRVRIDLVLQWLALTFWQIRRTN